MIRTLRHPVDPCSEEKTLGPESAKKGDIAPIFTFSLLPVTQAPDNTVDRLTYNEPAHFSFVCVKYRVQLEAGLTYSFVSLGIHPVLTQTLQPP